jgi:hypothetical protein
VRVPQTVTSQGQAIDLEAPFCIQVSEDTVQCLQSLLALIMPWAATATSPSADAPLTPAEAQDALAAVLRLIKMQFTRLHLSNVGGVWVLCVTDGEGVNGQCCCGTCLLFLSQLSFCLTPCLLFGFVCPPPPLCTG